MLSKNELLELESLLQEKAKIQARKNLYKFTKYTFPKYQETNFHKEYYKILDLFAKQEIKNLIISMPPQHGKSEGSSRRLPAFICGTRPDTRIALVSYAATKAQKFGREIMSIMREKEYIDLFPDVQYPERGYTGAKSNTNELRESINTDGYMKFVGVDGALTGDPVDLLILDDLYKNWEEANSPVISEKVWNWYTTVADTRLHNDSQQLIVFTRWSDHDLIARLEEKGLVKELGQNQTAKELSNELKQDEWVKINFQAIKENETTLIDPREKAEPLWPERHNLEKLESSRTKNPVKFSCLYQGEPETKEGNLYSDFKTYAETPTLRGIESYTDTADEGKDYLCSIVYSADISRRKIYILDVLYTQDKMELTEPLAAEMFNKNNSRKNRIESNNGGRGFARAVEKMVNNNISIEWFHQSKNKFARIYSNSSSVNKSIVFPDDWESKWPIFAKHVRNYKKENVNKHDDAPDALTGVYESVFEPRKKARVKTV